MKKVMEKYDLRMHLGQQLEFFLNGYTSGNLDVLERAKRTIMDLYKNMDDDDVIGAIEAWDKEKQSEITKLWDKARESIKTIATTKKGEELFIDIDEIKKDVLVALNELEVEYLDSIRDLLLKNVSE